MAIGTRIQPLFALRFPSTWRVVIGSAFRVDILSHDHSSSRTTLPIEVDCRALSTQHGDERKRSDEANDASVHRGDVARKVSELKNDLASVGYLW